VLRAGADEVNALAQGALRQIFIYIYTVHPVFMICGSTASVFGGKFNPILLAG